MKRNLAAILSLVAMMIIISHDIIPHFHPDKDEILVVLTQLTDDHHHDNNDDDHTQKNHFPPHQHFFSDGDFFTQRNSISLNKVIKESHHDYGLICSQILSLPKDAYFAGFIRVIKEPLSSFPFIIPINSTRGSPSIS